MIASFRIKKINLFFVFLFIISFLVGIYWYWFYPRIKIGYEEWKVSKCQWDAVYPDAPFREDTSAHTTRHRLDSPLLYEAFLLELYGGGLVAMDIQLPENLRVHKREIEDDDFEQENDENNEEITFAYLGDRLRHGIVQKRDASEISDTLNYCRAIWREEMRRGKTLEDKWQKLLIRYAIALYFYRYYDFCRYGKEMDRNEWKEVAEWLNRQGNESEVRIGLNDPLGWDCEKLEEIKEMDDYLLEYLVNGNPCAELLIDIPLYEKVGYEYRAFLQKQGLKKELCEKN